MVDKPKIKAYLDGGHVSGPGTSRSDSIPAKLSNGEFVINADVVKKPGMLEFLKRLNNGEVDIPGYQDGGFVDKAQELAKMLAPGKVAQVRDFNEPQIKIASAMSPTMFPPNPVENQQKVQNVIPTPVDRPIESAQAPITDVNPQMLKERIDRITAAQSPEEREQLKLQLADQLRNLEVNPQELDKLMQTVGNNFKEGGLVQVNSEFNWDEHPVVDESNASFDWESQPLAEEVQQPDVGAARSALVGAGQGATFGFGEELTAPIAAAAGMAEGLPSEPNESTWNKYQRLMQLYRDTAREEQQAAQEQHPYAYTGGAVVGGLASMKVPVPGISAATKAIGKGIETIPGAAGVAKVPGLTSIAKGMAEGAGYGGVYGAGEAQGDISQRLEGAKEGAETGAIIGGVIPTAIQGVKTVGKTAKALGKVLGGKAAGEAYIQGTKGTNILGKEARTEEFKKLYGKSGSLVEDINSLFKKTNDKIKVALKAKEGSIVDIGDELEETFDKLNKMKQTEEGAKYANDVESELKHILGIKSEPKVGIPGGPEGLILPELEKTKVDLSNITPQQAQDIKQVMYRYSPAANLEITPQKFKPAQVAGDISATARKELAELSPELAQANDEFDALSKAHERLKINDKLLPEQQTANVAKLLNNLEKGNLTAFETQQAINDVVENIKLVDPKIAAKYGQDLNEISKRLDLIGQLQGGTSFGKAGIFKRASIAGGNKLGLGVSALKEIPGVQSVTSFADKMIKSPMTPKGGVIANIKAAEPYQLQRKVADASENADPETLKEQAQEIRTKYGTQGEQLATILDNMANKDKNARRALMFTILQNQAYRKMLGLSGESKDGE